MEHLVKDERGHCLDLRGSLSLRVAGHGTLAARYVLSVAGVQRAHDFYRRYKNRYDAEAARLDDEDSSDERSRGDDDDGDSFAARDHEIDSDEDERTRRRRLRNLGRSS